MPMRNCNVSLPKAALITVLFLVSTLITLLEKRLSKYKGHLQMKMSLRFTVSGVLALIMGALALGNTTPRPILFPTRQESLPSPILN